MKAAHRGLLPLLLTLLFPLLFFLAVVHMEQRVSRETLDMAEKGIRRAALQCYALEGAYPQNVDDLKERYGVSVDEKRFRVDYIYIGSNLMPDITVVPLNKG